MFLKLVFLKKTCIQKVGKNIKDIEEDPLDPDHVLAKLVELEDRS